MNACRQIPIYSILVIILSWFGCSSPSSDHVTEPAWVDKVDSLIRYEHALGRFDGSMVIGDRDGIQYQIAIGIAERTWDVPISQDTRFDIASLNKSFQAALILLAAEEGKLNLNDPLSEFFPNLGFDPNITIHHLLTHTSGIPDYGGVPQELRKGGFRGLKRLHFENDSYAKFISELETIATPGTTFHYSNFGYHLLCLILEKVYQKPFPMILKERICEPYELTNTYSETQNQRIHEKLAEGYQYNDQDSCFERNEFINLTLGRRIFSTASDLFKWSQIVSQNGLLSSSSYALMTTNHLKGINPDQSYGYGFVVFDGGEYKMGNLGIRSDYIIHGGETGGYKSLLVNIQNGDLILAILSNIGDRTNEMVLSKKILKLIPQ